MKKLHVIIIVLVLLLASIAYWLWPKSEDYKVVASGTVEVHQYDITPRVSGYLDDISVDLGSSVQPEELLFTLQEPTTDAEMTSAKALLEQGKSNLADLQAGARENQLMAYKSLVDSARVQRDKAAKELERYNTLFAQDAVAAQLRDSKQEVYDIAEKSLAKAEADYEELLAGTRQHQIEAAQAQVVSLEAQLYSASSKVADLFVKSPVAGRVLTKNYEKGEYVKAGAPVLTIADMKDAWIRIYVSTEQLALIKVGDEATITIDGLNNKSFTGYIERISPEAEYTPRQSITKTERPNLVYEVRIKVPNEDEILKPGMPADVVIL